MFLISSWQQKNLCFYPIPSQILLKGPFIQSPLYPYNSATQLIVLKSHVQYLLFPYHLNQVTKQTHRLQTYPQPQTPSTNAFLTLPYRPKTNPCPSQLPVTSAEQTTNPRCFATLASSASHSSLPLHGPLSPHPSSPSKKLTKMHV